MTHDNEMNLIDNVLPQIKESLKGMSEDDLKFCMDIAKSLNPKVVLFQLESIGLEVPQDQKSKLGDKFTDEQLTEFDNVFEIFNKIRNEVNK